MDLVGWFNYCCCCCAGVYVHMCACVRVAFVVVSSALVWIQQKCPPFRRASACVPSCRETLRVLPIVPSLSRKASKDFQLGSYLVKGVFEQLDAWAIVCRTRQTIWLRAQ